MVMRGGGRRIATLLLPFGGRQRLHRQRMNLFAHAIAQCAVHNLVALHARFALKGGGDNHGLKVRTIAIDGEMFAIEFGAQVSGDVFRGDHGIHEWVIDAACSRILAG